MKREPLGWVDRLAVVGTIAGIGLIAVLCIGPHGLISDWWSTMRQARKDKAAVVTLLPTLYRLSDSDATSSPTGSSNVVFEFFDYECPFCLMSEDSLRALATNPGMALRRINDPLPFHSNARRGASAAICAYALGHGAQMHEYLVLNTSWHADTTMQDAAHAVGVDPIRFEACMTSPATAARIDSSIGVASELRVQATPTFITIKGRHQGVFTAAAMRELQ